MRILRDRSAASSSSTTRLMSEGWCGVLTAFGYAMKHAAGGVEGLQLVRLFEPDRPARSERCRACRASRCWGTYIATIPLLPGVILSGNQDVGWHADLWERRRRLHAEAL
jgi:hypothetical protein